MPAASAATDTSSPRSHAIVAVLYLMGVISMALIGILSPLAMRITGALDVPREAIGLTIALFSLPSAAAATFGGTVVDRLGARLVLIVGSLVVGAGDVLLMLAPSLWIFDMGMLLVGIGFVGLVIAVPVMIMAVFEGHGERGSLAFWPTYGPIGFSLGLLMAAPFTGMLDWRLPIAAHGLLMAILAVAAMLLFPNVPKQMAQPGESPRERIARLFVALRDPAAVRLAVAISMPNMISYGTSLVAVTYLARVHGVSLAASATVVAAAKIVAMLLGGTLMGALLARNVGVRRLFLIVVTVGILSQVMLYFPASPLPIAIAGLMIWLFAFAGQCGVCWAMMPALARGKLGGGAISGLVNQVISIGSFLTAPIYFALPGWTGFIGLAVFGGLVSLLALPRPGASSEQ